MPDGIKGLPSLTGPDGPRAPEPQLPAGPGGKVQLPDLPEMPKAPRTPGSGYSPPEKTPPVDIQPPKPPSIDDLVPKAPQPPAKGGGGGAPELPQAPTKPGGSGNGGGMADLPAPPTGPSSPEQPGASGKAETGLDSATRDALKNLIKQGAQGEGAQQGQQGGENKLPIDPQKLAQLLATVAQQASKKEPGPSLPLAFSLNPAVEKPTLDPKQVPSGPPSSKAEAAPMPLAARLPAGNYKVELPQFLGWEREIPKSTLPQGATLQKVGNEGIVLELPVGSNKTVTVQLSPEGAFTASARAGEELRGKVQGSNIVVERWDVSLPVPKQTAEWRSTLPPPCPVVLLEEVTKPVVAEEVKLEAEPADLQLGIVLNLVNKPLEVYLTSGEIVSLAPHAAVQLTARELDSPHIQELERAKLVAIKLLD